MCYIHNGQAKNILLRRWSSNDLLMSLGTNEATSAQLFMRLNLHVIGYIDWLSTDELGEQVFVSIALTETSVRFYTLQLNGT